MRERSAFLASLAGGAIVACAAVAAAMLSGAGRAWPHEASSSSRFSAVPAVYRTGAPDGPAALRRVHAAPSGWTYPLACCSGKDCREVPASLIKEGPEGYVIRPTGEAIAYTDRRVRVSPDGLYHWCSVAGADDGRTICLFVPARSF